MFLWLAHFSNWLTGLNIFQYTTFRAVMAALTALAFSLLLGPWTIRKLTALKVGQAVRTDGPQTHLVKNGTPTMGGSLILTAITVSTLGVVLPCDKFRQQYPDCSLLQTSCFAAWRSRLLGIVLPDHRRHIQCR